MLHESMHFRAPSVLSGMSNMRRRSAGGSTGAISYKHPNPHASFAISQSQPNVSGALGSSGTESSTSPVSSRVEGVFQGYHNYAGLLGTSDGTGEDTLEPATMSSSANDALSDSVLGFSMTPQSSDEASSSFFNDSGIRSAETDSSGKYQLAPMISNTTGSVDFGHRGLLPFVGTTIKFTHRWPKPRILKYLDPHSKLLQHASLDNGPSGGPALEKGQGFGVTHLASWTTFKWLLIVSVMTVFAYGCAGLIMAIMTWFNAWQGADVMLVADNDVLVLITLAGSMLLFTSLIGLTGTLLNSRPILAVYALLLWPAMLSLLAIGYTSYRRYSLSLDHKLNYSWSRYYTPVGRRVIQDSLQCCGFYSAMHEASPSKKCYLRAALPGCKAKLFDFERTNLRTIWKTVFALFPLHLANIVVALLCVNHITSTFGKGIVPPQYRLTPHDVKADADKLLVGIDTFIKPGLFQEDVGSGVVVSEKS